MVDGYARASIEVAATYGQAGPGAANVAAALADAHWAQSPVFALTCATATDAVHAFEYQDIDQHTMFGPVTKWNGRAQDPRQVAGLVREALDAASAPSAGPTHLDVPKNYFGLAVEPNAARGEKKSLDSAVTPGRETEEIVAMLRLLLAGHLHADRS